MPQQFKTYPLLRPLAWLYRQVMAVRNHMFDTGLLKTSTFGLPVISVGNISVGGTGKTPMCGYLLQLLYAHHRSPALLSRGYGRKTKGFLRVTPQSTAAQVGDEPLELYKLYQSNIPVYVCENRCEGAHQILSDKTTDIHTLVLDDAYQHRYIHRDLNIMLTDYSRLYSLDKVMPEGRLRESPQGASRADIIVVTKCPDTLTATQATAITQQLHALPHQQVFFCAIRYATPIIPYGSEAALNNLGALHILIVTGIAKPAPLVNHYQTICKSVDTMQFADHHAFNEADIEHIARASQQADIVVTTSKDFQRLPTDLPQGLREKLIVQPITIEILFNQQTQFDNLVLATAMATH